MMEYDDRHRIFLQGIMNSGVLSRSKAKTLLQKAYNITGQSLPSQPGEINEILRDLTCAINKEIQHLNLAVVKAIDENKINKEGFFVLINQLDRSEELTELTKKSMVEFSPHELEFLKILMDEMIKGPKHSEEDDDSEDEMDDESFTRGEIEETRALNLGSRIKSKTLKPLEVQEVIDKFIDKKWLRLSEDKVICFAPRFIVEMETYLRSVYPNDISNCSLCNKIVVKSINCTCEKRFHLYCLGAAIPKGHKRDEATKVSCPKCKCPISLRRQSGSRKRSLNDDDDE